MHNAIAYVRTSADKDDAFSLDSQLDAIRRFAALQSITIPSEYELREEFTGRLLERPQLSRLRSLVRAQRVTAVIVYATDRLSRSIGTADIVLDELFANGVRLYIIAWGTFVRDTPEDRLRFNFEAAYSDFERRKIAERMARGKNNKLKQGLYLGAGTAPYGYRKVGDKRQIRLEIIEDEAVIIRQIFHWYIVDQLSVPDIARRLRGTPTPAESKSLNFPIKQRAAGDWALGTIYHILKYAGYSGSLTKWGTTITIPSIIEADLYDRTIKRLGTGQPDYFHTRRHEYLMSGRLTCSYCGYTLGCRPYGGGGEGIKARLYYCCPSKHIALAKPKCILPLVSASLLDDVVWEWLHQLLLNPTSLHAMLDERSADERAQADELRSRLARIEARISEEQRRLAVLIREFADAQVRAQRAPAVRAIYQQTLDQVERLLAELTEERDTLRNTLAQSSRADTLRQEILAFAQTITADFDSLPFAGRRDLVDQLDLRGEVAAEDGQLILTILIHGHRIRRVLPSTTRTKRRATIPPTRSGEPR